MMQENFRICDLHCDTVGNILAGSDLKDKTTQVNLPYLQEANVGLQVFACYIPSSVPNGQKLPIVERMLDRFERNVSEYAEEIVICRTAAEARLASQQGKIAAVLAVENGMAIENDLRNLQRLYDRGVRLMTIVHARSSDWVISSNDNAPAFDGLSDFGCDVIAMMNELGMIIDLSHSHDLAVEKILRISKAPVTASHSCARSVCSAARNLPDHLIKGIANSGGVIGLNFFPGFLDADYSRICEERAGSLFAELSKMEDEAGADTIQVTKLFQSFSRRFLETMQDVRVPIDRIVDHAQHIADLVGDDFICFGSDFDGVPDLPEGVNDCRGFAKIIERMANRGAQPKALRKICWDNFLRVFEAVCG